MVDNHNEKKCNGCKMCSDLCPVQAISFHENDKGFWIPKIDHSKCINCNLCSNKCPQDRRIGPNNRIISVRCAWSKNDEIRLESTSGGISYELCKQMIEIQGYAVGCTYTNDYRGAYHKIVNNVTDLKPLMQSKYLQSDTNMIYKDIKKLLKNHKKVLFVGTPCQNAALLAFLGKTYEELITVEFICKGITSPYAHRLYIDYLENKYNSKITYFRSKDKREGWNNFGTYAKFENGEEYFLNHGFDPKVVSYHQDLTIRESCQSCRYKGYSRVADITLADFWGIEKSDKNPKLEYGTSAVIINSQKGLDFFMRVQDIDSYEKKIEDVVKFNPSFVSNAVLSKYRKRFWDSINRGVPFDEATRIYGEKNKKRKNSLYNKIKSKIRSYIK